MSGLTLRPTLSSFITLIVTAFLAVFLFASPAQSAQGEAYLIVPDMVLGNVEGTEEVFSSLYTELEKQGVPAENIVNLRYDPYDGITTITEEFNAELDALTQATGDTEISVLGYGVGGLIVRNYLESDNYTDNIESVVFGATPHEGTIAYTEHIYGKNITYLNAWERLYWEGKDVPMLMKQVLPTILPLVGVSLEDEALTPLREAVTYSIIDDLKNREQDAQSPIKNLPVTNLRPSGYRDGWYITPIRIRTRYETTLTSVRQQTLEGDLVLELERGVGDGYVSKNGGSFTEGTTRDYWAEHTDFLHQGIRDIISGLGLSTENVDQYHNGRLWYEYKGGPYPKSYHSVAFKTDVTEDLDLVSLDTSTIENVQRFEEAGRVILFGTALIQGQVEARIESHARQDIYLTTFLANPREHILYPIHTFQSEVGERFTFTYDLKPYCSTQSWETSCSLLSNDAHPHNVWQETSREWIQYPIILVHGILGSFNQRMLLDNDANLGVDLLDAVTPKNWDIAFDIYRQEKWINLPTDNNWNYLRLSLEESGFEENEEYYRFFYDWRQPITESGVELSRYIDFVQDRTDSRKVNIIAHSMGGLVTRSYVENMGGVTYENDIARFTMVGTPNQGSVDSIPMWYGGDIVAGKGLRGIPMVGGQAWYLAVLDNVNPFTNNPQGIRESIRTFIPSTRDLLPTWGNAFVTTRYLNAFDNGYIEKFNPMDNVTLIEINKRSNDSTSNLRDIEVTAIAGIGLGTGQAVFFQEENPFTDFINLSRPFSSWYVQHDGERQYFNGFDKVPSGDGTVLERSVFGIENIDKSIPINDDDGEDVIHRFMLRSGDIQREIFQTLKISNPTIVDNIPFDPNLGEQEEENPFIEDNETLSILEFSPASIEVVTPSGVVLNESKTDEEFKEVGASYLSLGDTEKKLYLFYEPEQGEYTLNLTGTGEGEYTVTTFYESNEQIVFDDITDATTPGKEDSFTFSLSKDDTGKVIEEEITLVPSNTPPIAVLDQIIYEGVEGVGMIFDGSSSSDEDGDTLQYKWFIKDTGGTKIYNTEYLQESTLSYTFDDPFEGSVTLTVTDGEFEESVSADISVRAMSYGEKIAEIRGLLESLEEDTNYIQAKKRLWLRLVDMLELPQVENNGRLKEIIIRILKDDIERSLIIDSRLESSWMWWRRRDLISDSNKLILENVQNKLKEI